MKRDRNHAPKPARFGPDHHANRVAQEHRGEVDVAEVAQAAPQLRAW